MNMRFKIIQSLAIWYQSKAHMTDRQNRPKL